MSGGEIAALIAAGAFLMLVVVLAVPLLRLRHTVDAATQALQQVNERTGPMLDNVNLTGRQRNTALGQAQTTWTCERAAGSRRCDDPACTSATAIVANLVRRRTSAAANPLVKAAAFTYGVRKASARRKAGRVAVGARRLKARKRFRRS
jgi:hypothetical protein